MKLNAILLGLAMMFKYAALKSAEFRKRIEGKNLKVPVSYTHLTLPTILRV